MSKKTKVLNDLTARLIKVALGFIDNKLTRHIEDQPVKQSVKSLIDKLEQVVDILNDNQDQNKERIRIIMLGFISEDVINLGKIKIDEVILKVKDPQLKATFQLLLDPVLQTISEFVDGDGNNEADVKALWAAFIKSPENQEGVVDNVMGPLLSKIIKDADVVDFITGMIKLGLSTVNDKEAT